VTSTRASGSVERTNAGAVEQVLAGPTVADLMVQDDELAGVITTMDLTRLLADERPLARG
jgi:hypothetical protein